MPASVLSTSPSTSAVPPPRRAALSFRTMNPIDSNIFLVTSSNSACSEPSLAQRR